MAERKQQHITTVGMVALGCAKNVVDSEKMLAIIGQSGFVVTGQIDQADVVVINTCGFIAPARAEAIEEIQQAVELKRTGRVRKVIVAGCLAQRMGRALHDEVKGIDVIVGLDGRDDIGRIIRDSLRSKGKRPGDYLYDTSVKCSDDRGRLLITPGHWAYLRISEGCDRKCAFCTIPAIRGAFRSKDEDMIIAEARELTASGVVELSIIAQDSNYYGCDKGAARGGSEGGASDGLSGLIVRLEKIEDLRWIRLMYLYPAGVDDRLIETIAACQKVVNYIDMPIQHINDHILQMMRRADRKDKTVSLIDKLRLAMPEAALRTTVIVGFPGETDDQFQELMDFIRWAKFDSLGCFTFYPEYGTVAADMPGQIPDEVKQQRADAVMMAQQQIAFEKGRQRIGSELVCLVDEIDDDDEINDDKTATMMAARTATGRHYGQAPYIDSICRIHNCRAQSGEFINCRVTGIQDYDLLVEQIGG